MPIYSTVSSSCFFLKKSLPALTVYTQQNDGLHANFFHFFLKNSLLKMYTWSKWHQCSFKFTRRFLPPLLQHPSTLIHVSARSCMPLHASARLCTHLAGYCTPLHASCTLLARFLHATACHCTLVTAMSRRLWHVSNILNAARYRQKNGSGQYL